MPEPRTILAVTIGRGGVSLHTGRHSYTTGLTERELPTRLARAIAGELIYPGRPEHGTEALAPNALVIDSTPIPEDDIVRYAVRGPMIGPELPAGTVDPIDGPAGPWVDDGTEFGARPDGIPVGGFDTVASDVQAIICRRFGGTVTPAHELAALAPDWCKTCRPAGPVDAATIRCSAHVLP